MVLQNRVRNQGETVRTCGGPVESLLYTGVAEAAPEAGAFEHGEHHPRSIVRITGVAATWTRELRAGRWMSRRDARSKGKLPVTVSRRGLFFLATGTLTLAISGCVDDDTGRQFANEPPPTSALPTSAARSAPSPRVPVPQASPISPAQLLQTRGAAGRFYFLANGELWTTEPRTDEVGELFAPPTGMTIRALAPSPSGDRVAVVLVSEDDDTEVANLIVLTNAGEEVGRYDRLSALAPEPGAQVVSLDWSPQGDKLLAALAPGGLVAIPLEGDVEPSLIVSGGPAVNPGDAAWSPTGEEVGFLAETGEGGSNLFLAGVAATPTGPEPLLADSDGARIVYDWAWLPDGRAVLFSEARGQGTAGDLWRIRSDGTDRELVASAGSVAPVARVVGAKPSRDGRSVAYIVVVPGGDGEEFNSLWVRHLATNQGLQIDVPPGAAVTDFWWTNSGLIFRTVPVESAAAGSADGLFALYRAADGTAATRIYASDAGPEATPAATPLPPPEGD